MTEVNRWFLTTVVVTSCSLLFILLNLIMLDCELHYYLWCTDVRNVDLMLSLWSEYTLFVVMLHLVNMLWLVERQQAVTCLKYLWTARADLCDLPLPVDLCSLVHDVCDVCDRQRLWSDCANAQTGLGGCWLLKAPYGLPRLNYSNRVTHLLMLSIYYCNSTIFNSVMVNNSVLLWCSYQDPSCSRFAQQAE